MKELSSVLILFASMLLVVPYDSVGLPGAWTYDPVRDVYYRPVTSSEVAANEWDASAWLVEHPFVGDLTTSLPMIAYVINETTGVLENAVLVPSKQYPTMTVSITSGAMVAATSASVISTVHQYRSAVSTDQISAIGPAYSGWVATPTSRVMVQPLEGWATISAPLPRHLYSEYSIQVPRPRFVTPCLTTDIGLSPCGGAPTVLERIAAVVEANSQNATIDAVSIADPPRDLPMGSIGETKYCSRHGSSWSAELANMQGSVSSAMTNGRIDGTVTSTVQICYGANLTPAQGDNCANTSCTFGGRNYIFSGYGADAPSYMNSAFTALADARLRSSSIPPLMLVEVVHWGLGTFGTINVCGLGDFYNGPTANLPPSGGGATFAIPPSQPYRSTGVAAPIGVGCFHDYVSTHEVGHNLGADPSSGLCGTSVHHDNCRYAGNCYSVMEDTASQNDCVIDMYSASSRTAVNSCFKDHAADCPRTAPG